MLVQVILKEDIQNLGKAGSLVSVRAGYARNFLLPKGFAILATLKNLVWLKEHRSKLEEEAKNKKAIYLEQKSYLESQPPLQIGVQVGPTGQIFGRITSKTLSDKLFELSEGKFKINHKDISIKDYAHGISELGNYSAKINLGADVFAQVELVVYEDNS